MYLWVFMYSIYVIIWCPICTYAGCPKTACEIKHDGINYDQPVDFGVYCFQTNPNNCIAGPRTRLYNSFGPTFLLSLNCSHKSSESQEIHLSRGRSRLPLRVPLCKVLSKAYPSQHTNPISAAKMPSSHWWRDWAGFGDGVWWGYIGFLSFSTQHSLRFSHNVMPFSLALSIAISRSSAELKARCRLSIHMPRDGGALHLRKFIYIYILYIYIWSIN